MFQIVRILREGGLHRAEDIAARTGVSVRTIYRDMEALERPVVPVSGARGVGYRVADTTSLPPLTFTPDELEALNLGMAVVAEAADTALREAAVRLTKKLDAALPERSIAEAEQWKHAVHPFADAARAFLHLPTLRAAIRARQKLRLTYQSKEHRIKTQVVRPLEVEYWGRIWTLTGWCELRKGFREFRVDLIASAEALPEMFIDEPGKRLVDFSKARQALLGSQR